MYKRSNSVFKARLTLRRDRLKATEACHAATLQFEGRTEKDINSGECFEWATIVFDLLEGSKIAGHNINGCGHSWIEYRGLCWDAETPQGVRGWLKLPFWQRLKKEAGAKEFNRAVRKLA